MIWFWRYLSGFLTIILYGENAEKVLNQASKNGINIWNLRCKKGNIIGNIGIKNFIKLRYIKRGIKCKIKILHKKGLVFKTNKYIKRIGFFSGVGIFFLILFILSNFVWVINIEGNKTVKNSQILDSCKKINIYEGVNKKRINTKYDAQRLLLEQEALSWCSLNIEGCVLAVNISEANVSDKQQRSTPSNLKAKIDGKIKKIDVTSGNVLVNVGDTVSKGDLLVSGIVENFSHMNFVYSDGIILAQTTREFSAEGNFSQNIKQKTGRSNTRYTVDFFNVKIPFFLGSIKKGHIYNCNIKNLTLFDKKIPIKIAHEKHFFVQNTIITYDAVTLEEKLYANIKKQVEQFDFITATETKREIINTDKGILLKIIYDCEENIAVQNKILISNEN